MFVEQAEYAFEFTRRNYYYLLPINYLFRQFGTNHGFSSHLQEHQRHAVQGHTFGTAPYWRDPTPCFWILAMSRLVKTDTFEKKLALAFVNAQKQVIDKKGLVRAV